MSNEQYTAMGRYRDALSHVKEGPGGESGWTMYDGDPKRVHPFVHSALELLGKIPAGATAKPEVKREVTQLPIKPLLQVGDMRRLSSLLFFAAIGLPDLRARRHLAKCRPLANGAPSWLGWGQWSSLPSLIYSPAGSP